MLISSIFSHLCKKDTKQILSGNIQILSNYKELLGIRYNYLMNTNAVARSNGKLLHYQVYYIYPESVKVEKLKS